MPGADRREGADLVVVGASVGGLTAAITAADRGCQVILVERTKDLGGGAATAGEAVVAAGTRWQREAGVADDPERLAADLLASGIATEDGPLVGALATQSGPLVEWLADRCGATIQLLPAPVVGHGAARLHACTQHGGASLVAALGRVVSRHHRIRLRTGTEVTQLVDDVAATRADLEGEGVRFLVQGIADVAGLRTTWFADPWNNVFILVEKVRRPDRPYFRQY